MRNELGTDFPAGKNASEKLGVGSAAYKTSGLRVDVYGSESKRFDVLSDFWPEPVGPGNCRRTSKCVSSANFASRILASGDVGEKSRVETA